MTATPQPSPDVETVRALTAEAARILTAPPRRAAAVTYLRHRGIDTHHLPDTWAVGYAPPGWTRLVDELRPHFSEDAMLAAGLATRSSRGSLIDTFRDRVIFPIRDHHGRATGFLGRDLSGAPTAPKYLNTRETAIYHKGQHLYGMPEALSTTATDRIPVVVEGPLDVLAITTHPDAASSGITPVAACGTAFTTTHARLVAHLAGPSHRRVIIAMDGDPAGRCAAITIAEQLRTTGLDVRIAVLPNGVDPADHLTQPGATLNFLHDPNTLPPITFHVEQAITAQGDRMQWIEGRLGAARAIANYLTTYPARHAATQIGWIADALHLEPQTFTTELADAYKIRGDLDAVRSQPAQLTRNQPDISAPTR